MTCSWYRFIQKCALLFMAAVFIGTFFLSLLNIAGGMTMAIEGAGCPFMNHEETLCSMSILEVLDSWSATFTTLLPQILILATCALVVTTIIRAPHVFHALHRSYRTVALHWLRERTYTYTYRPLQELFAHGILHPKIF